MTSIGWKNISHAATALFALALAQASTTPVQSAEYDVGSIHITAPWARATPKGASAGAAYVTIANKGTVPDRVTCVSSDASAECQIHTMATESGVMKMRPVEGGLEIKPRDHNAKTLGLAHNAHAPQTPPRTGQDGRGDAAIREGRTGQNRVPRRGYRRCSARHSLRRRSWRHDANGQALTELTDWLGA